MNIRSHLLSHLTEIMYVLKMCKIYAFEAVCNWLEYPIELPMMLMTPNDTRNDYMFKETPALYSVSTSVVMGSCHADIVLN